jgi:hypothetical protein
MEPLCVRMMQLTSFTIALRKSNYVSVSWKGMAKKLPRYPITFHHPKPIDSNSTAGKLRTQAWIETVTTKPILRNFTRPHGPSDGNAAPKAEKRMHHHVVEARAAFVSR